MKVRRVIEIEGPKDWVEAVLKQSFLQPNEPAKWVVAPRSLREVSREVVEE